MTTKDDNHTHKAASEIDQAEALHQTRKDTAYHEAGHVVVARWFEWFEDDHVVTIIPNHDEGSLGMCQGHNPLADIDIEELRYSLPDGFKSETEWHDFERAMAWNREETERFVMFSLAGGLAEKMHNPNADPVGCTRDHRSVTNVLDLLMESRGFTVPPITFVEDENGVAHLSPVAEAYWKWLEASAEAILDDQWDSVERLAEALLERETLTGGDVAKILSQRLDDQT